MDILKIAQAAYVFEPQSLLVPTNHIGNNTFSLDALSRTNGHTPVQAHDALSDVQATIFMAKILRQNAPQVWSQAVRFSRKASVTDLMDAGEVCILTESYRGSTYHYPVMQIGLDPSYAAVLVVADLRRDFSGFLTLSDEDKLHWLRDSPQPIRKIKANASPMLMPIDEIDSFPNYYFDTLIDAAEYLSANNTLCADLTNHFLEMINHEFSNEFVEQQLYDCFPDRTTENCWSEFHKTPWESRWEILKKIPDPRYRKLGMRLIFEHSPDSLPDKTRQMMANFINTKKTGMGYENPPWRTLEKAILDLAEARTQETTVHQTHILDGYGTYLERLM